MAMLLAISSELSHSHCIMTDTLTHRSTPLCLSLVIYWQVYAENIQALLLLLFHEAKTPEFLLN